MAVLIQDQQSEPARAPRKYTVRELRQANNLTLQAFADLLDAAISSVINWEQGKYRPQPYFVDKMCRMFGIGPSQLVLPAPERKGPKPRRPAAGQKLVLPE